MKSSSLSKIEGVLSRSEMKKIKAGAACSYIVSGSWTGKLRGCSTTTTEVEVIVSLPGLGGATSISESEEKCCYDAYDPYDMGYTGEKCINGAAARQC